MKPKDTKENDTSEVNAQLKASKNVENDEPKETEKDVSTATPSGLNTLEECQKEIQRLSRLLSEMQSRNSETVQETITLPISEALIIHKRTQEAEKKTYDVLKGIATRMGPQLAITPTKIEKPSPFTSPLKIRTINIILSLFKVKTIGGELENDSFIPQNGAIEPKYLSTSRIAFKFGITEACFVMESEGFDNEIKFLPGNNANLFRDIRGLGTGPVSLEASRTDYIFLIFETVFKIFLNSQFILSNVEFKTEFDRDSFAGDLVSLKGMLKNQYVDQSVPLLPAAGYGHSARYLLEKLNTLFEPSHHGMRLGELARDSISQKKVFRRAGVVTDQYTARMNEVYLDYLFARSIDHTSYITQHRVLTLPNVSIKVDKPSIFTNSLIPIWRRNECDGCLLMYALDVKRQQKYLLHLTELFTSVNLLTFATVDEIAQLPPRRSLRDAEIQQLLDTALTSVNENEVFRAIALDLSSTWVDTNIIIRGLSTTPLDAVFKIFTVVLWFCYFPSIARDNVPKLMFELFTAMEELATDETTKYVRHSGFSNYNGRNATIQEYPKELYLQGTVNYPLLLQAPPNRFKLFRQLHGLLVANHGEVQNTSDNDLINTPRMGNTRRYYQPYHSLSAVSNVPIHGENPNDFGNRLKDLHLFMKQLIEEYKRKYRDYTNRSAFGNSTSSVSQLLGYFDAYSPSLLYSIGIRGHAELFILRHRRKRWTVSWRR